MKIIIFGASGFLGAKLYDSFSLKNEVIGTCMNRRKRDFLRIDVTNRKEVEDFILNHKPDIIIDMIALTSSVACEREPGLCEQLNYQTAQNIVNACRKVNAKMIFISSSYIFDGNKGDYREDDPPLAKNQYAKTKLMAEKAVLELDNFIILRIEMTYGVENKKIRFGTSTFDEKSIDVGYPNQLRNPLFADDLPRVIYHLIKKDQRGVFHIAGPDKISLIDFLRKLARLENSVEKIKVVDSSGWILKFPENPTLNISKIESLGINTTPLDKALIIMKNQL